MRQRSGLPLIKMTAKVIEKSAHIHARKNLVPIRKITTEKFSTSDQRSKSVLEISL